MPISDLLQSYLVENDTGDEMYANAWQQCRLHYEYCPTPKCVLTQRLKYLLPGARFRKIIQTNWTLKAGIWDFAHILLAF